MLPFKEVMYVDTVPTKKVCVLVADIGGTNSNFGFFDIHGETATMLFSLHFKSQDVTNFTDLVKDLLRHVHEKYEIVVHRACFAAAGVTSEGRDYCKPTNLAVGIDAKDITKQTSIECTYIINDFEVIGYGVKSLEPEQVVEIVPGVVRKKANQAVLGAGTGLGKCILAWEKHLNRHVPLASEGGHADFAPHNQLELDLVKFIQEREGFTCSVSWEGVLSGNGIKRIYAFFKSRNNGAASHASLKKDGLHPDEIFNSRELDEHARNTFELYTKLYARCAKNFALETLCFGGLYIAGGIASHNLPMFQLSVFMQEFVNCGKQQELLKEIPIYVITDYNVSLYGTARYMMLEDLCGL